MLLKYVLEKEFPVSDDFYARVQEKLKNKMKSSSIDSQEGSIQIFLTDTIRDIDKSLSIIFKVADFKIMRITIETDDAEQKINEYDLKSYLHDLILDLLIEEKSASKKKYVIRNYLTYFNSYPMKIDMVVHGKYKMRFSGADFPYNQEPLNENVFFIDTEIESPNLSHALSLAYNNAKDVGALLSVLLDVGFFTLLSERKIFIQKIETEERKLGFVPVRFRTGFVDPKLGIVVKDNLNGLKSVYDGGLEDFFSGVLSNEIVASDEDTASSMLIFRLGNKENLEKTFLNHEIKKGTQETQFQSTIEKVQHYMNLELKIPQQIRTYFKNIYKLEESKYRAFISAARLYNISLTAGLHEPTVEVAYKISALEALGKSEKIRFSALLRKYVDFDFDTKLADYYYGNIRSGHFHSGEFAFNEYNVSLVSEFDFSFKEKFDQKKMFERIIRNCLVNWIDRNILSLL